MVLMGCPNGRKEGTPEHSAICELMQSNCVLQLQLVHSAPGANVRTRDSRHRALGYCRSEKAKASLEPASPKRVC